MKYFAFVAFAMVFHYTVGTASAFSPAPPKLLFSFPGIIVGQQGGAPPSSFTFPVFSSVPGPDYSGPPVILNQRWTVADVGKTVSVPAASNIPLGIALTDGVLENLSFDVNGIGDGYAVPEPYAIFGNQYDPRIDLHGDTITSYSLTLNSLSVSNNGYQYQTTFAAYGYGPVQGVPEPGTLVMLLVICAGCTVRRRRLRL